MRVSVPGALASLFLLWQGGVAAAESMDDRLRACVAEPDDALRLACYDQAMGRAAGQPADFGMTPELMRKKQAQSGVSAPPPPADLSAAVTRVSTQSSGRFLVTLDNGQVWAQQENQDFTLKPGDLVTIKPGLFGALWMLGPSHRSQTRVKRVK